MRASKGKLSYGPGETIPELIKLVTVTPAKILNLNWGRLLGDILQIWFYLMII